MSIDVQPPARGDDYVAAPVELFAAGHCQQDTRRLQGLRCYTIASSDKRNVQNASQAMHFSSSFAYLAVLAPLSVAAQLQPATVQFFWDKNCNSLAETVTVDVGATATFGGPNGAQSFKWTSIGPCQDECSESHEHTDQRETRLIRTIADPLWCKNNVCSASDPAILGNCKTFANGVWARCASFGVCLTKEKLGITAEDRTDKRDRSFASSRRQYHRWFRKSGEDDAVSERRLGLNAVLPRLAMNKT